MLNEGTMQITDVVWQHQFM